MWRQTIQPWFALYFSTKLQNVIVEACTGAQECISWHKRYATASDSGFSGRPTNMYSGVCQRVVNILYSKSSLLLLMVTVIKSIVEDMFFIHLVFIE